MKITGKSRTGFLVILASLLVAAVLLPQLVSVGWHLAHGRTVNYRTWKVSVPLGWYAMSRGEGMSVERMSELPWQQNPVATFLPVHFTKAYPFRYDLFAEEQARTMRGMGYLLAEQRNVQVAGKGGRCWTFNSRKSNDQLWITCIVPKDLTSADYEGSKAYANDFFSLLTASQHNPAAMN
ncbi:MAG: hypothetical protein WBD21_08835 [Candidatus Acidiferrales bacterium]